MSALLSGVDRAAFKIANGIGLVYESADVGKWQAEIAEIIYRETGVKELAEALERYLKEAEGVGSYAAEKQARAAIAKAEAES